MRHVSPDAFIVSPSLLTRELLAEMLRARLGIRCSGMAGSVNALPPQASPQLLIIDGDPANASASGLATGRRARMRVVQIDSSSSVEDVLESIRKTLRVAPSSLEKLTPNETTVLLAVASGHRNADIARRQRRSIKTVEKHRANVQRKLGIRTVAQLTAYTIRAGLLDLETILAPRRGS